MDYHAVVHGFLCCKVRDMEIRLQSRSSFAVLLLLLLNLSLWAFPLQAEEYKVSAEDILNITVFDEPELSVEETRVSSNGTVALPLIGDVRVTGMTTAEIAAQVEALLADGYLKKPKVSVSIDEYRQIFVNGEVKKPGGYSYQEGLTVQKAVVLAGGFTERASPGKITLVRENSPNVAIRVALDYSVRPGDIITVGESFF